MDLVDRGEDLEALTSRRYIHPLWSECPLFQEFHPVSPPSSPGLQARLTPCSLFMLYSGEKMLCNNSCRSLSDLNSRACEGRRDMGSCAATHPQMLRKSSSEKLNRTWTSHHVVPERKLATEVQVGFPGEQRRCMTIHNWRVPCCRKFRLVLVCSLVLLKNCASSSQFNFLG